MIISKHYCVVVRGFSYDVAVYASCLYVKAANHPLHLTRNAFYYKYDSI